MLNSDWFANRGDLRAVGKQKPRKSRGEVCSGGASDLNFLKAIRDLLDQVWQQAQLPGLLLQVKYRLQNALCLPVLKENKK